MHFLDEESLPTLRAGRVVLRQLEERDIPELFRLLSHPEVARYTSRPPMQEIAEARTLYEEIRASHRDKSLAEWGIALAGEDRMIGTATLFGFDRRRHRAELGYMLVRDEWGRGYVNEALTVLLDHAFNEAKLHRLEADADPRNTPSLRVLDRLGFEREGYLRERWLVGDEIQDTVLYGLLAPEWRARRGRGAGPM